MSGPRILPRFSLFLFISCFCRSATVPPGNYVLVRVADGGAFGSGINSIGQVVGNDLFAFLWTPVAPNSGVGSVTPIGGIGTSVGGINNLGQMVGSSYSSSGRLQTFLWTPSSPNATTGSFTILPLPNGGGSINNFGQVTGLGHLWTPASPNGTIGTVTSDSRFVGDMAINDFGQVVMNPTTGPLLFTPSAANATTGSFTPIPGLTAADGTPSTSNAILAINNNGTVLGLGQFCNAGLCQNHAFLWTPTVPNGATGTVSEIPTPAGFSGIQPVAINAGGQVIGNLDSCGSFGCDEIPFLYSSGMVYDLSAVDSRLSMFSSALAINAAGQIVITIADFNSQGVFDAQYLYLLSPTPIPTPAGPATVTITIASVLPGRGFTVTGNGCSPGVYPSPQTLNWTPQSNCTVAFVSPQSDADGTQYVFTGWQDGAAANPRVIVAPAQAATYTANYQTQYLLSAMSSPPEGGTVSGGGWYAANSTAVLTTVPANGYRFAEWASSPAVSVSGPTSASITVSSALTVTADFVPIIAPSLTGYAVTGLGAAAAFAPRPLNSFGQVVYGVGDLGGYPGNLLVAYPGNLWTPFNANGASGAAIDLFFAPAAINNYGQIVGAGGVSPYNDQALLWSPSAPNGSFGNTVLLANSPSYALGINNFGQAIGELGGEQIICPPAAAIPSLMLQPREGACGLTYTSSFLWTPSVAGGATGSNSPSAAGLSFVAINDFGQAISSTGLYTPSASNGPSGTVVAIPGIPSASGTELIDINASGVIAGESSFCTGNQCLEHGFLWTPVTPNATMGTLAQIPIPTGYVALQPTAMNNSGQVLGIMTQSNGINRPFLFRNGTVYDLGTVSSQFSTAGPAGINDSGQIVLNTTNGVYLLSPGALQAPGAGSVSPGSGSALNQTMVFTFSDPRGWQDLDVVNILINNFLDGRRACYLAYSRSLNVLYLVNDTSTALLPGLLLNGSGSLANSQCTVYGGGSNAAGNGNSLALMLNMSFSPAFDGNKVVYLAARDVAADSSGWQALGTWNVPGAAVTPTAAASLSPARGATDYQTFTLTFTDTRGWQDLGVVDILINNFLDGRQGCYFAYSRPLNQFYVVNDAGAGTSNGMANSQCSVTPGYPTSASGSGNTLTLTVSIEFSPSFVGNRVIYMAARDVTDTVNSGWQAMGSWTVQ